MLKGGKKTARLIPLLCFIALLFSLFPTAADALFMQTIDRNKKVELTISCNYIGVALEGVEMQVYQVGHLRNGDIILPTDDFAEYNVDLNVEKKSQWRAVTNALRGYAIRDGIEPLRTATTDEVGYALLDNLEVGLYMITFNPLQKESVRYTFETLMILLPVDDEGDWDYEPFAQPKMMATPGTPPPSGSPTPLNRKVLKVWVDNNDPKRPEEVTVQLLCYDPNNMVTVTDDDSGPDSDGKPGESPKPEESPQPEETAKPVDGGDDKAADDKAADGETRVVNGIQAQVVETVKLNKDNGWSHTWEGLDPSAEWLVVEKDVPEGYTVTEDLKGITFVITNTKGENTPTPTPPTGTTPPGGKVPQTGLLWWPVPVLLAAGLALLLIGLLRRRNSEE